MSSSVSSFCGSRTSALRAGAGLGRRAAAAPARGVAGAVMRKRDIHPEWFPEAKVFCNGVEVMTVGGTKQVCSELQKKALLLSLLCSNHSHAPAAAGVAHTHVILMSLVMQFAALVLQGLSSSPPPPVAAMACCLSRCLAHCPTPTLQQYTVDIYSGNHPFYQGNSTLLVVDEGQLNKFKKRFGGLEEFAEVCECLCGGLYLCGGALLGCKASGMHVECL